MTPTGQPHTTYMATLQNALESIYHDHTASANSLRDEFLMALGDVNMGWITRQTEAAIRSAEQVNRGVAS